VVASGSNLEELAHRLAAIASATSDAETGCHLLGIVEELLEAAGLPHVDSIGGGDVPGGWNAEPAEHAGPA
jgi:hypothetical protein